MAKYLSYEAIPFVKFNFWTDGMYLFHLETFQTLNSFISNSCAMNSLVLYPLPSG